MEGFDLSAIEAKYPRAKFSATIVNEQLGIEKRNGRFISQYAELTAYVDGKGHITAVAAPDGITPEILMSLAGAQYAYFKHHGVDITGKKPGAEG